MDRNAAPRFGLAELTRRLRRGDDDAWEEFHREYGPRVFRHLLALTRGDEHVAAEALQQTYLRVARYVRPTNDAAQFRAWLRLIARSALADCRRREHRFWSLLRRHAADPTTNTTGRTEEALLQHALEEALAELDPDMRSLLESKYFDRLSVDAIAEQLGASPKAVESRLTRARADLRARIVAALSRL